jgi:hypothetical protein
VIKSCYLKSQASDDSLAVKRTTAAFYYYAQAKNDESGETVARAYATEIRADESHHKPLALSSTWLQEHQVSSMDDSKPASQTRLVVASGPVSCLSTLGEAVHDAGLQVEESQSFPADRLQGPG